MPGEDHLAISFSNDLDTSTSSGGKYNCFSDGDFLFNFLFSTMVINMVFFRHGNIHGFLNGVPIFQRQTHCSYQIVFNGIPIE